MVVPAVPNRLAFPVAIVVSTVAVAIAVPSVEASLPWYTTYPAVSDAVLAADAVAALFLIAAGVAVIVERPSDGRAPLLPLTAGAWACSTWVGWQGGPDVVRTLGVVGHAALLPLVLDLGVRTWPAQHRHLVVARSSYLVAVGLAIARLLVDDPTTDSDCWQNCTANTLLVSGHRALATGLAGASLLVSAALGAALVAVAGALVVGGRAVARRTHLPVLGPAALVGCVAAVSSVLVLAGELETASDRRFVVLHVVTALALTGLGAGFVLLAMRSRRARRLTGELAGHLLATRGQSVRTLLSRAIGDPSVQVAYRVRDPDGWVDPRGLPVASSGAGGAGTVPVTRGAQLVAVVSHDPAAAPDVDLADALGPAARLAVENESLEAQQLARLHELQESQRRIVESADAERTRLERNLHDAAQVSVLALTATLQRALRTAPAADDPVVHRLLSGAVDEVHGVIDDLRRLAHGIHPAVLDLEGLAPALESLGDEADIRVAVDVHDVPRLPPGVERTAYAVAVEAVREAARAGEDDVLVTVRRAGDWVEIAVDGTAQSPTDAVRDRVGAMGGLVVSSTTSWEVRVPCGS
jgi:signal transduction histidine kinase